MSIDPTMGGAAPALSGEEIVARVEGLSDVANFDIINFSRLPGPHAMPDENAGACPSCSGGITQARN